MTDLSWLEYISNPYAVIAVIAAVLGANFKSMQKNMQIQNPKLVLAMYGMFLVSITSLGLSVIAISFLSSGRGATDAVSSYTHWQLIQTAHAQTPTDAPEVLRGWLWAGEVEEVVVPRPIQNTGTGNVLASANIELGSGATINDASLTPEETITVTTGKANLRATPPTWRFWSWFTMRYQLGELLTVLEPGTRLEIQEKLLVGKQLWLQVITEPR